MQTEVFEAVVTEKPQDVKELTLGLRSGNEISGVCSDPLAYEGYLMLEGKGGEVTAVGVDEIEYLTYKPAQQPPGQQGTPDPKGTRTR